MPSERVQRQIDLLLDEIEAARASGDWLAVKDKASEILDLDPDNKDADAFLAAAGRRSERLTPDGSGQHVPSSSVAASAQPTSFTKGRYEVKRFLGEGGKKKVYLAHDTLLDRDVAFALIKTEGLDATSRERITREAQSMGRLGDHPNIVTVFDIGTEDDQPYMVLPLLPGGDIEGLIGKAPEHRFRWIVCCRSASRPVRGLNLRTQRASFTATSSRVTSGSPPTAAPRSATSASPSPSTDPGSRRPA